MDRQIGQLPAVGVAVLLGLGGHPLHGDHHVPQGHQAGARVGVLRTGQLAGGQVEGGEAQHIGGPVHLPHIQVNLVDGLVVGEAHVHLAGEIHPLRRQGGADGPAEEGPLAVADPGHIRRHRDVMSFCHIYPFSSRLRRRSAMYRRCWRRR